MAAVLSTDASMKVIAPGVGMLCPNQGRDQGIDVVKQAAG